jgi:hypothetical protein
VNLTTQIQISPAGLALINRIDDTAGLLKAIAREVDIQNQLTIGHIRTVRMRGNNNKPFPPSQHILGIGTGPGRGLLNKSIRASKARVQGETIISSIGTNVRYAGIHEFGGTIKRVLLAGSVRLATDRQGNLLRQGKNGKLAVFARKSRKTATTVAYAGGKRFEIRVPARAPFRTGIQDRLPEIGDGLARAAFNFYKGGNQ